MRRSPVAAVALQEIMRELKTYSTNVDKVKRDGPDVGLIPTTTRGALWATAWETVMGPLCHVTRLPPRPFFELEEGRRTGKNPHALSRVTHVRW